MRMLAHRPDVFKTMGKNIMTPNAPSFWIIRHQGMRRYVEIAEGTGLSNQPIFGVTVRPDVSPRLSKLFQSRAQAMSYLGGLDE